jgi:hypothetical protein
MTRPARVHAIKSSNVPSKNCQSTFVERAPLMGAIPLSAVENTFCPILNLMSNTPRTNEKLLILCTDSWEGGSGWMDSNGASSAPENEQYVPASLARELELELAQEKAGTASLFAEKNALEDLSADQGERVFELELELNDQVLCNGRGAEREADLLGKVERLEREIARLREALNNIVNMHEGNSEECDYSRSTTLLCVAAVARSALSSLPNV